MSELIVNYPDRAPERLPLGRLRITIGRSARNDVCVPDPFASRVHAEVRREGDQYLLQDLGSANGTYFNGSKLEMVVALTHGSRIQIGETEIVFKDKATAHELTAPTFEEDTPLPEATIAFDSASHTSAGLLEAIEGARTQTSGRFNVATIVPQKKAAATTAAAAATADQGDLLALISKVGVTLLASATLDETLRQVARLVFDAVPAERCLIMLREEETKELRVRAAEMRDQQGKVDVSEVRVSRTIVEEVVRQGRSVLTSDAQHDPRFMSSTVTFQGIRSVLAVPLGVGESVFGMIYADSPFATSRFTEDHLKVLTTLGSVAAIRVENTRLLEEHMEQQHHERELQLAREIQQRFQPTAPPIVPGYELQGISFPSYQIGGDYYDFINCADGRLVVALGDVSGKGTSAALLMSSLHAAVHAQVASCRPITQTIGAVNRYLADNTPANRFVTLFYAELDPLTGSLSFINAGHNPPIIAHAGGTMEHLAAGGLPLGIVPDFDYHEGRTQLQPGDVLVSYSDGVNETQNPKGEEFGMTRLQEVISQNLDRSAAAIRDKIEAALSAFAQGTPAVDDITLLIVKRAKE
ncbi:MAG: SpoIIE family protein phosphatase [Rubrivivax sp.]|nr:SpoIIE family protein phosphatase [Pyrinomonadaceae bacterium]